MKILMTSTLALGAVGILALNQLATAESSDSSDAQLVRDGGGHGGGGHGGGHRGGGGGHRGGGGAHMGGGGGHRGEWSHEHHDGHHHGGWDNRWGPGVGAVGVGVGLGVLGSEIYEDGSNCSYDAALGRTCCYDEYGQQYCE